MPDSRVVHRGGGKHIMHHYSKINTIVSTLGCLYVFYDKGLIEGNVRRFASTEITSLICSSKQVVCGDILYWVIVQIKFQVKSQKKSILLIEITI